MSFIEQGETDRLNQAVGEDFCPDCGFTGCRCELEGPESGFDEFQEMLRKYYESEQQEAHAREFFRQFWGGPSFVNGGR